MTDEQAGAQYYFDAKNHLFWTWDTPALISRKFDQIVRKHKLGGVMAWSLGEDSFDWSHIKTMAEELKKGSSGTQPSHAVLPAPAPSPTHVAPACPQILEAAAASKAPKDPYNIVWVDGTREGPAGDQATQLGSPEGSVSTVLAEEASSPQQKKPIAQVTNTPLVSDGLPFSPEYLAAIKGAGRTTKVPRDVFGRARMGRRVPL
jgi:chitinase